MHIYIYTNADFKKKMILSFRKTRTFYFNN